MKPNQRKWVGRTIVIGSICYLLSTTISALLFRVGFRHLKDGGAVLLNTPVDSAELEIALHWFEWAARVAPLSADAKNYQGDALLHLKRYNEALKRFDATLRLWPRSFTARYGKATAYMKLQQYDQMAAELRRCISIEPDLDSRVQFSRDFAHLRQEPFMKEFSWRMRENP
jgi:tetratricopeptide (TPR) repeat protein